MDRHEEQLQREAALRQAALGRRVQAVEDGRLGPVLRRWINSDVVPIADNLRRIATLYLSGDMEGVALALGTPTSALTQRERPLRPLMEWCLRGRSPGRAELADTSHAEDLALAFMGSLIPRLAKEGATLSAALGLASDALRDTVQGQFITGVQGAEAMQKVRENNSEKWRQRRSLQRIAMQMRAQVKPQMLAEERGELVLPVRGNRKVIHVTDYKGDIRRLEFLRTPDAVDWEVMSLCWHDIDRDGGTHPHRNVWMSFAFMLLSIAQQTGGWFEVVDRFKHSSGRKHKTKFLQLSEKAHAAIARDVERWVGSGFVAEPMLVPPEDGDYLSVKHHKVTGQRPPKGLITDPEGTFAWQAAVALSQSPWRVNSYSPALDMDTEGDPFLALKLAAHRRLGGTDFYLPVNMDFRGRVYYRTPWVTPQSNDLGKSLLRFPKLDEQMQIAAFDGAWTFLPWSQSPLSRLTALGAIYEGPLAEAEVHVVSHLASLYGLDKAPIAERMEWFRQWDGDVSKADSPLTLKAHMNLISQGQSNSIPVQLDGTCNGLQHLSALMRDEVGASQVNLTEGTDRPQDVYGLVARRAEDDPIWRTGEAWTLRFTASGLAIGRSLCKQPVMVLPYGGTFEAIRLAVKASVLEQLGVAQGEMVDSPWHRVEEDGYSAFKGRALADHPLFNEDIRLLSRVIYQSITPSIPKAMAAMDTLQAIGKWVGTRALAWQTGPSRSDVAGQAGARMWVVQAKSKATRKRVTFKGYHLPDVIRRLTLVTQSNEVDPRAHRTGIVANFIHSLDAEHLARTVHLFKSQGGSCVGTIHDCVMCRPSETALMHSSLRQAFCEMYEEDPLSRPVKVISTEGVDEGTVLEYSNWHEIAAAAGTSFPSQGTWQPSEVMASQWFFS